MVVNCPPKETCGKPISSGFVVTPCRPACAANGFPAFGLVCPPATVRNANRASFRNSAEKTWVQLATPFSEWVLRLRPKPGSRLSCNTPDPNGSNWRASNSENLANAVSFAENW